MWCQRLRLRIRDIVVVRILISHSRFMGSLSNVPEKQKSRLPFSSGTETSYKFCKEIYGGSFYKEMLTYPEILDAEKVSAVNVRATSLEKFLTARDFSLGHCEQEVLQRDILEQLKEFDIFGLRIPNAYGGANLTTTEYAKVMEAVGINASVSILLSAHEVGVQALLKYGSVDQHQSILPSYANGDWITTFCLNESVCGTDVNAIVTRGVLSENRKTWKISGLKKGVANGFCADVFTVVAVTQGIADGRERDELSLFIVNRDSEGVTVGKPKPMLGAVGAPICEVHFSATPVPTENTIQRLGEGSQMILDMQTLARFNVGCCGSGTLKKLINFATEFTCSQKLHGKNLSDFAMVQAILAEMTCKAYAIESMIYLTAGIMDSHENPDCLIETAVLKVFTTEALKQSIVACRQLFGNNALVKGFPYEQMMRDVQVIATPEDGNDFLRFYVSVIGMEYAKGSSQKEKKSKSFSIRDFLKKLIKNKHERDGRLNLGLHYEVHPSLEISANQLDSCLFYSKVIVEHLFETYGEEVRGRLLELCRLTDVIMHIFAMTAVIGRASRSYCIGLQNADHEVLLASSFCTNALREVKYAVEDIIDGHLTTDEKSYQKLAQKLGKEREYFLKNPFIS